MDLISNHCLTQNRLAGIPDCIIILTEAGLPRVSVISTKFPYIPIFFFNKFIIFFPKNLFNCIPKLAEMVNIFSMVIRN